VARLDFHGRSYSIPALEKATTTMRARWILGHFGLTRPYRFERTILAFFALLLLTAIIVAAIALQSVAELNLHTPRSAYVAYLAGLSLAALALLRLPRLAAVLIVLSATDLCLGVGTFLLKEMGERSTSLLPENVSDPVRFAWHPLLQAVPIPSLSLVTSNGIAIHHTSRATRGREPTAEEIKTRHVIAVFGGSSTYDVALTEGKTWADSLEKAIGQDRFLVINHGVPGYTTVEHLIQTAFYEDKFGRLPRCAIYYVGWNDIRNAHINNLDAAYADFHLPSQVDSLKTRRIGGSHLTVSPLLTLAARLVGALVDTVQYSGTLTGETKAGSDPALEADYERNIRSISAINRGRGVRTIWVPQQLNRDRLMGDDSYGWLPYVYDKDVWSLEQRFNDILAQAAQSLSDVFVDLRSDAFISTDFVDQGHFSASGASKFARILAPVVTRACQ
jgi:hypothetical protein